MSGKVEQGEKPGPNFSNTTSLILKKDGVGIHFIPEEKTEKFLYQTDVIYRIKHLKYVNTETMNFLKHSGVFFPP